MPISEGRQIKVLLPDHLLTRIEHDADQVGVPLASMVRMIIAGHYELLANQQPGGAGSPAPAPAPQA